TVGRVRVSVDYFPFAQSRSFPSSGFLSFQDHSIIELLLAFETFLISCVTRHVGFKTGCYGRSKVADVVYSASRFQRKQGGATRRRFGPFRQQQRPAEHIRNDL